MLSITPQKDSPGDPDRSDAARSARWGKYPCLWTGHGRWPTPLGPTPASNPPARSSPQEANHGIGKTYLVPCQTYRVQNREPQETSSGHTLPSFRRPVPLPEVARAGPPCTPGSRRGLQVGRLSGSDVLHSHLPTCEDTDDEATRVFGRLGCFGAVAAGCRGARAISRAIATTWNCASTTWTTSSSETVSSRSAREAAIPALNRLGICAGRRVLSRRKNLSPIYVLLPHKSPGVGHARWSSDWARTASSSAAARRSWRHPATAPAYKRMESSLMVAFQGMPHVETPDQVGERIFQLRIYESPERNDGPEEDRDVQRCR